MTDGIKTNKQLTAADVLKRMRPSHLGEWQGTHYAYTFWVLEDADYQKMLLEVLND